MFLARFLAPACLQWTQWESSAYNVDINSTEIQS
uniref:Uncharacterized protein n=1 Tax=Rhizophora mucronata TaxID=61149 RepID=A0A2P2NFH7_RHIMU